MNTTPPISLQEALDIINTLSIEDAINDGRLMNFISCVDMAGTDILKDLDDERILGAVAFIKSTSLSVIVQNMMESGDTIGAMSTLRLVDSDIFEKIIAIALKMSVGLSALEEWR